MLLVPALLALGLLVVARLLYPDPRDFEPEPSTSAPAPLPRAFWTYLASVGCLALGYADFPLIAFHLKKLAVVTDSAIPALYAFAMAIDALGALALGRVFGRRGMRGLLVVPLLSFAVAPLAFSVSPLAVSIGVALWGLGMGAQESIVRAAIASMVPVGRRGTAYGVFNAVYGAAWFGGSALMGFLYDASLVSLVVVSVASQMLAIPILVVMRGQLPEAPPVSTP